MNFYLTLHALKHEPGAGTKYLLGSLPLLRTLWTMEQSKRYMTGLESANIEPSSISVLVAK